jgi:hypothetical protein
VARQFDKTPASTYEAALRKDDERVLFSLQTSKREILEQDMKQNKNQKDGGDQLPST